MSREESCPPCSGVIYGGCRTRASIAGVGFKGLQAGVQSGEKKHRTVPLAQSLDEGRGRWKHLRASSTSEGRLAALDVSVNHAGLPIVAVRQGIMSRVRLYWAAASTSFGEDAPVSVAGGFGLCPCKRAL
jgi:hypothetical protein